MSLFAELKRRNVFRVGIAYLVAAWLLIQLSDILVPMLNLPGWVPRLIVLLLLIGVIPTLIAAWAFEMTPDGVKREKDVDRSQSIAPKTGHRIDRVIIGVLALALILLGIERLFLAEPSTSADAEIVKSIAVLPFADLSQNQDQEWFADGLAEEILNALTRIPDLLVASRTATFGYKGTGKDIPTIAGELGVAHVLEGSVRRAGDRLRVTAQLIRASDGFHLWSENYDRDAADIIDIQEDLALHIAQAMETAMDPAALADMLRFGTRSVEAYQAYIKANALAEKVNSTLDGALGLEAFALVEKARQLDPDFWAAHFRSAMFWMSQLGGNWGATTLAERNPEKILEKFNESVDTAIRTAPNAIDRNGSAAIKAEVDLRLRDAIRLYRRYLEERPNDLPIWRRYISVAQMASDTESALAALEALAKLGETSPEAATLYVNSAYKLIDPSDAADYGLRALERWPDHQNTLYQTHRTLLWARRFDEGSEIARRLLSRSPNNVYVLAREACVRGDREEVLRLVNLPRNQDTFVINSRWLIWLMLGEKERVVESLQNSEYVQSTYSLAALMIYPKFDPAPFPSLMKIIEREHIDRPPPVEMTFGCPATE